MENTIPWSELLNEERIAEIERLEPFKKRNEVLYTLLEDLVVMCKIPPGTRVSSTIIARMLNVSRTPVEEAMNRLKREGLLVEGEGGKGLYTYKGIEQLRNISLDDLFEARKAIECAAARRCAMHNFELDLEKLRELAQGYSDCLMHNSFDRYTRLDNSFHRTIAQSCGNGALARMYSTIERLNIYYMNRSKAYLQRLAGNTDLKIIARQHLNIYEAIERGSPDTAESAMRTHLDAGLIMCLRYRGDPV